MCTLKFPPESPQGGQECMETFGNIGNSWPEGRSQKLPPLSACQACLPTSPPPGPKCSCHFREHPPMQLSRTHSIPWWCVLRDSVGFQLPWGGGRGWSREHRFRNHLTGQMAPPACYCSSVCLFSLLSMGVITGTYRVVLGSAVTSVSLARRRCSGTGEGAWFLR